MNIEYLRNFEEEIAKIYESGKIRAPIHLRDGNEKHLINIFKNIKQEDYIFSTWASHLHALLKGVPPERVKKDILEGRSITLHYPEYNFYTSAIVGGICPIATGVAYAIKKQNKNNRVYCFIGDMTFHTGIAYESIKYSIGHSLPITFVIEDNGKSVETPTKKTWGIDSHKLFQTFYDKLLRTFYKSTSSTNNTELIYYKFNSKYPHTGTGIFVEF